MLMAKMIAPAETLRSKSRIGLNPALGGSCCYCCPVSSAPRTPWRYLSPTFTVSIFPSKAKGRRSA